MPVPPLPNEIITAILEELWLDLSVDYRFRRLFRPVNSCAFFCPLLLVSKTWYHLVLPYSIAYVDARNVEHVSGVIEKQGLGAVVRAVSFEPFRFNTAAMADGSSAEDYKTSMHVAKTRWTTLLQNLPKVEQVEIGRNLFRWPKGERPEAAGNALLRMWDVALLTRLRYLRLELPEGASFDQILRIVRSAPSLTVLELRVDKLAPTPPPNLLLSMVAASPYPPLERIDFTAWKDAPLVQIITSLVEPTSATLTHLRLSTRGRHARTTLPPTLPQLRFLDLDGRWDVLVPAGQVLHAPRLDEVALTIDFAEISLFALWLHHDSIATFVLALPSLHNLELSAVDTELADYSHLLDRDNLSVVQTLGDWAAERNVIITGDLSPTTLMDDIRAVAAKPDSDARCFESEYRDDDTPRRCYEANGDYWECREDRRREIYGQSSDEGSDSSESLSSEEEEDDWDAEDDLVFRSF